MKRSIVIQAGGESRRMGQNKALMDFGGEPLVQRVVNRIREAGDEVFITANQPAVFDFLKLRIAEDLMPGKGALGGIYTALSAAAFPLVGIVACDMPFANPRMLTKMFNQMEAGGWDIVIPGSEDGLEPLHAVYRRETCLPVVESALKNGELRVHSWFDRVRISQISPHEILMVDPQRLTFTNVNRPGDWENAIKLAEREESITNGSNG